LYCFTEFEQTNKFSILLHPSWWGPICGYNIGHSGTEHLWWEGIWDDIMGMKLNFIQMCEFGTFKLKLAPSESKIIDKSLTTFQQLPHTSHTSAPQIFRAQMSCRL
jgi:hypothetical protein